MAGRMVAVQESIMRSRPNRPADPGSATQDPRLHGVGHGFGDLYAGLVSAPLPEAWQDLLTRLDGTHSEAEPGTEHAALTLNRERRA